MKKYAMVSRHQPTPEQITLAAGQGIEIVHVGDRDAWTMDTAEFSGFDGVIVVHPWAAMTCLTAGMEVGIFNNVNRAPVGQKPDFFATELRVKKS